MNFRDEPGQPEADQPAAAPDQGQSINVSVKQSPIAGTGNQQTADNPSQSVAPLEAAESKPVAKKPKLQKPNLKLPKFSPRLLKQYGPVLLAVVVLLVGVGIWQQQKAADTAKWNKAADYHGRAEYQKAADTLKDTDMPSTEKRLAVYAQTMLATRQLDRALPAYEKLYEENKDPSTQLVIGNILNEQKKYKEAEAIYQEVITENKSNVQAYVNLATLYKLQNKDKEAVSIAKKGVEANQSSVVLRELQVSMLLEDKSNPEFQAAVDALRKLNPQDPLLEAIKQS